MGERIQINPELQAILLYQNGQWRDNAQSINAMYKAYYYGKFTGYDIYFKNGSQKFFFSDPHVHFVSKVCEIDTSKYDVFVNDTFVLPKRIVEFQERQYRVYMESGILFTKNVRFESKQYLEIYKYFSSLAQHAGDISEPDSPLFYLSQNYARITPQRESVLRDFLRGVFVSRPLNSTILLPLDFNQSQIKAIETAFQSSISVIEGPPGTGKTQTILNLIANIAFRGWNCAVVSNNNAAIENVYAKLEQEELSFLCAMLGRKENVERFFEEDHADELHSFLDAKRNVLKANSLDELKNLQKKMKTIQDMEVETSKLDSVLIDLKNEFKHHQSLEYQVLKFRDKRTWQDHLKLISRIQRPKRIHLVERMMIRLKYGVIVNEDNLNNLLVNAEHQYYMKRIAEVEQAIHANRTYLFMHSAEETKTSIQSLSMDILKHFLAKRYQDMGEASFHQNTYKQDFASFLKRFPIVLSTSQSLLNNAKSRFLFDYLIIDEASQGDLLSSVLAISCAKNLVVVGDSRQLQQIDESGLTAKSKELARAMQIPEHYLYHQNSILKSVRSAVTKVPVTLLREHYRCAPDIISFCNKMFYNNELVAMTKNTGRHLEIIKTVEGNHARRNPFGSGQYNQREIDEIMRILAQSKAKEIGVITPFRYQANQIAVQIGDDRLEADTIHKFQGRQKEEVILSFVVNSLEKNPDMTENRLYDFVTDKKLLNVAISRGQNKVTAIVSDKVYQSRNNVIHDFIEYAEFLYGSTVTKQSTITSIFDYLYSDFNEVQISSRKSLHGVPLTEITVQELIPKILKDYSYIGYSMHARLSRIIQSYEGFDDLERKYLMHPWTHVDFLFYHKVSRESLFVVEIDGVRYHEQQEVQSKHDSMKDKALTNNGIPIHRFKTNESNEEHRLRSIIGKYVRE